MFRHILALFACAITLSAADKAYVLKAAHIFDAKSDQNAALLSILDAELSAADLPSVFEQVLKITAKVFGASVGVLMLKEMGTNRLQARAKLGFDADGDFSVEIVATRSTASANDLQSTSMTLSLFDGITRS